MESRVTKDKIPNRSKFMHFELYKIVYYYYHLNSCNFKRTQPYKTQEKFPENYEHVIHWLTSNPITHEYPHAAHISLRIWTATKSK